MKITVRVVSCLVICALLWLAVCALVEAGKPPPPPPTPITRTVTFSTRDDWNKGEVFAGNIDLDFSLVNQLGVDELVCSFGWDDYEPAHDVYDFAWLHDFVNRAATYGIKLRPYICYAPDWATGGAGWNAPPTNYQDWYDFCYNLANAMKTHSNIVSYEIWNEWNETTWWTGTFADYANLLLVNASNAIRAAQPGQTIIMGGLVWPHYEAIDACTQGTLEQYYEIAPFHGYAEWGGPDAVEAYLDAQYTDWFVPTVNNQGEGESIWVNEDSKSTLDRTQESQRSYFMRAIAHFLASNESLGEIDHYCAYEIRDEDPNEPIIGPEDIRYLGLCDYLGNKKLSFNAVKMLVGLLDNKTITTPVNGDVTVTATSGRFGKKYHRLIKISDGSQILIIYDKKNNVTCKAVLNTPGSSCVLWNMDGTSQAWPNFDGTTISNIQLAKADVIRVFQVLP